MVITRTKAIHALLYLVVSFLALALVFYVLGAPFVAALEVIIYAGAIMVLFLFALMLINPGRPDEAAGAGMAAAAGLDPPERAGGGAPVRADLPAGRGGRARAAWAAAAPPRRQTRGAGEGGGHRSVRAVPAGRRTGLDPAAGRAGGRSPADPGPRPAGGRGAG